MKKTMMLDMMFPLRPNVNVSFSLPRDLTLAEVDRITRLLMALAEVYVETPSKDATEVAAAEGGP